MPYNTDLPPTIRRTNQTSGDTADDWVLETASGTKIASYTTLGMSVGVWWEDLLVFVSNNASSNMDAVNDITLLMVLQDWAVEA